MEPVEGDDDQGMRDVSRADEFGDASEGFEHYLGLLGPVEGWFLPKLCTPRQKSMAAIGLDGGVGVDRAEGDHVVGSIARLFEHLPDRRDLGRGVGGIDHASRDLQGEVLDSVAVLTDEHHLACGGYGDDVDPIAGVEDEEIVLAAGSWRPASLFLQIEDPCSVDGFAIDSRPGRKAGFLL